MGKILAIIAVGMPASLVFTAQVAVSIRKMVNTKLEDTPTPKKLPPFKPFHYSLWGASCPHSLIVYMCRCSRPAYHQVQGDDEGHWVADLKKTSVLKFGYKRVALSPHHSFLAWPF